jgi:hypothetical protein
MLPLIICHHKVTENHEVEIVVTVNSVNRESVSRPTINVINPLISMGRKVEVWWDESELECKILFYKIKNK